MTIAVIAAILMGFLLVGIAYLFFPDQSIEQIPSPKPMPKTLDQIFSAIFWIGIAASISIIIVGGIFLINQIKGFKLKKSKLESLKLGLPFLQRFQHSFDTLLKTRF